jgi:hypothetical protein
MIAVAFPGLEPPGHEPEQQLTREKTGATIGSFGRLPTRENQF